MTYARMVDGNVEIAPKTIVDGNDCIFNPTEEQYKEHGWLPYVSDAYPELSSDTMVVVKHIERDGCIVRTYTVVKNRTEMSIEDAVRAILPSLINQGKMSDDAALRAKKYFPKFEELCADKVSGVEKGFRFSYNDDLYKTVGQSTDFVSHYPPGSGTESMFMRIDETHSGSEYDPIPYSGNMELFEGKYYSQDGIVYLCVRNTLSAVFDSLATLSTIQGGRYVQAV